MAFSDSLLPEFDHEMAVTRRVLERVPMEDAAWKPHEKSMSLGQLAGHLATIPYWCSAVLDAAEYDLAAGADQRPHQPASLAALLKEFDTKVAAARASLVARAEPELLQPWTLRRGSYEIFTMPRLSALRSFVMNHSIHHRGQLSVYLRLKGVPLPAMYGPTADEG